MALAAVAVHARATLLHYDQDFDHIARAFPAFSAQWVVAHGTVD